jgi:hypothetical protein
VVALVVGGYFVLLAALGGHSQWGRLGVPPLSPAFADMRSVTSGWECTRKGIAVLPANPCDPYGQRPANYPHIWMWPSVLGLGQGSTVTLGILVGVLFLVAALAVLPRSATPVEGVLYGLAVCAPAVMLGVERGNVDLALFALVALGVLLLRGRPAARACAHAAILLAAILKLFPVFAAGALLRQPLRRAILGTAAVVVPFVLYAALTLGTIREIGRVVPQSDDLSYGLRRFTEWLAAAGDAVPGHSGFVHERLGTWKLDALVAALVVCAVLLLRRARPGLLPPDDRDPAAQRDLDLFWAGSGVYVLSYALFRSWDYRLAFLLMTVPQLLRWTRERRTLAVAGLVGVFGALWLDAWDRATTLGALHDLHAAVAAQFLVFVCCVAALAGTWPHGRPA